MYFRVLALASIAAAIMLTSVTQAEANGRDKPVVFVHGVNPFGGFGYPCPASWGPMHDAFEQWGWNGLPLVGMKYYAGDSFCEDDLDHHGSHNTHYGNNNWWSFRFNHARFNPNSHSNHTPIEHLGYHLAWTIYDHYTSQGQEVDLVGHSMGGLIIRYALTKQEEQHPDFPPELKVEDVATLETPHAGVSLTIFCGWSKQCREMFPGSSFLEDLGDNPQVGNGTDWTTIGSYHDPLVPAESAVAMGAAHRLKYSAPFYEHLLPLWDTSDSRDADFDYSENGGQWQQELNGARSVRKIDLALSSDDE